MKAVALLATALLSFLACGGETERADRIAAGGMCEVGIPWHFPSNRIDWLFNPTTARPPFNPEWTWQLNRMGFWHDLADAYRRTRDEKYARAFAVQLRDWLDQTGGVPPEAGYNDVGSPWRTIEEGIRLMSSWRAAHAAFSRSPSVPPALRERFVAAARAQANHLMAHRTPRGNWLLMEMTGVYAFAVDFPDFPESDRLRRESARIFSDAIREQVLPDGLQYELSPDYHQVFYVCAARLYELALAKGLADELPEDFRKILECGAEGTLKMMTPGFTQPRFNDCYTMRAKNVLEYASRFFPDRSDFLWGATEGARGRPPAGKTASRLLPYAGFAAMRSGWDREATYMAFDFGPLGMAHDHQDKLGFTLWKGDEELVFDDGGGQYERSAFRRYGLSGYDHNVLLVDGLAQNRREPKISREPIDAGWTSTPERDVVRGAYEDGFGPEMRRVARHVREVVFDKTADLFRLTDAVASTDGAAHEYELLFHVDTTNVVVSADGKGLLARFGRKWDLALSVEEGGAISTASGATSPRVSGWFVGRNDLTLHVATTISVKAPVARNHRFVTTLRPVRAKE